MSTIQQLKNFIRHGTLSGVWVLFYILLTAPSSGKQARNFNEEPARKDDHSPPQQPQPAPEKTMPPSDPVLGQQQQPPAAHANHDVYSDAPGDAQNRAAQAGHAAAHHVEPGQNKASSKSKRVDEANLAKLIAEENASKSKFPRYPGLERWELLEKMGDGAFSNVYRAKDLQGEYGEVGIKVVRKYEMNSMQVSLSVLVALCVALALFYLSPSYFLLRRLRFARHSHTSSLPAPLPTLGTKPLRETTIFIRILRRFRKQLRCEILLIFSIQSQHQKK